MSVSQTKSYQILSTTEDGNGTAFGIKRAISATVTINTDYTTAGAMTFSTQGYDGANWVVLDARTITDTDTTVQTWAASYPGYEQVRIVVSGTSGTITAIGRLIIKA